MLEQAFFQLCSEVICIKNDTISLVLCTASAPVLVPVQAERLFGSTAVYSCSWSYTAILPLANPKFRTEFQKVRMEIP